MQNKEIRVISGYGPQEYWPEAERTQFFISLESEIDKANLAGKEVIISMDANTKLGSKYIPKDRHKMCENGKILDTIIEQNNLTVANGNVLCKRAVTRKRVTTKRTEESSIDLVILSTGLAQYVKSVLVDEEQNHVLTRITKTKSGTTVKQSDHNVIITELSIPWNKSIRKEKTEILNFKNKNCQKKIYQETSKNDYLSSSFEGEEDLNTKTIKFMKRLDRVCRKAFRVIKVTNKKEKYLEDLYNKWNILRKKEDDKSKEECKKIEDELANSYTKEFINMI